MKTRQVVPLMAMVIIVAYLLTPNNQPGDAHVPTDAEKQVRYQYLLDHRLAKPLDPGLYPVFIFHNPEVTDSSLKGTWGGSGTALVRDGVPKWVLSAAHCFSYDGTYYITIVTPRMTPSIWGIESVGAPVGSNDVVMAKVGQAKPLKALPCRILSVRSPTNAVTGAFVTKGKARSLITGEEFDVLGAMRLPGEEPYFVMDYDCVRGESGSGFSSPYGILVLNGYIGLNSDLQKGYGVKPRKGSFALLTGVNSSWPGFEQKTN